MKDENDEILNDSDYNYGGEPEMYPSNFPVWGGLAIAVGIFAVVKIVGWLNS